MIKIGEFSKLSHITVKALRFYEKEGILKPAFIDEFTGYRFYETSQLLDAAAVKAYRQMGLSLEEIGLIISGEDEERIIRDKIRELNEERKSIDVRLSIMNSILEDKKMKYRVTEKTVGEMTVYSSETVLASYSDIMSWIPALGQRCLELNPGIKCAEPPYEFCEYPDGEYKETDIRIRHSEAVDFAGKGDDTIFFRTIPETKVLSIYHKGPYDRIGEAYAFIMKYAEQNGYKASGLARECYIDGIWNKESPEEWLTEIQLPV